MSSILPSNYDFDNAVLKFHTVHDYFMKKLIKNKGYLKTSDKTEIVTYLNKYLAYGPKGSGFEYINSNDNFSLYDTSTSNFKKMNVGNFRMLADDFFEYRFNVNLKGQKSNMLDNIIKNISSPTQRNAAVNAVKRAKDQFVSVFSNLESSSTPKIIVSGKTIKVPGITSGKTSTQHINCMVVFYNTSDNEKRVFV